MNTDQNSLDPRVFLTLPKQEKQRLLEAQAAEIKDFYQPGHAHLEWTESYVEDEVDDSLTKAR